MKGKSFKASWRHTKIQEIFFVSVDEASNRSRGYSLSLLISGDRFIIRKRWGRVENIQGRWVLSHNWYEKVELFNNYQETLNLIELIKRKRQKNGYVLVEGIKEGKVESIQLKLSF